MNEKPTPPEDWECCESQCSPCVWDTYYEDLREWNAQQKATQTQESGQDE
ncbi:oxidoreductase-like domain-containing protein [Rhodanobacter aciditrophus]|uniref:Oxidoreductase-like domain-containing protein n=1 Tax=Rhodanobacter aciditrophus TaxID=1623218 RepID=A0ABW4B6D9_9GAMM